MDIRSDLTWTCEAFGMPDVTYKWYKNGEPLVAEKLTSADASRYIIQDNILSIKNLNPERDNGMYQCQARNTLKTKYSSAQLRVLCSYKISFDTEKGYYRNSHLILRNIDSFEIY